MRKSRSRLNLPPYDIRYILIRTHSIYHCSAHSYTFIHPYMHTHSKIHTFSERRNSVNRTRIKGHICY
ncbi:hypothetical protein BX666DRAFT_1972191 [Dichotomocladium elegans]|nr:hypothetical protein BX666DRAFT_1972191 [Dichotomocladium elegans]